MLVRPPAVLIMAASLAANVPARADERSVLNACQALIDRAPSARNAAASSAQPADELQRCRQIVREWTLRDSRMSVDEHGRPLR
jgi:hypothetical protein